MRNAALLFAAIVSSLGRTPEKDSGAKPYWKRLTVASVNLQARTISVHEPGLEIAWDKTTRCILHRSLRLKDLKRTTVLHVFGRLHSSRQPGGSSGEQLITDVTYIGTGDAYEQPPLTPATKFVGWHTGTLQSNRPPYSLKVGTGEYRLAVEDDAAVYSTEKTTPSALSGKPVVIKGLSDRTMSGEAGKQRQVTFVLAREAHVVELNAKHAKVFQLQWTEERKTGAGLRGEYFERADLTGSKLIRTDATVDFDWGTNAPDPSLPVDGFSVRWTGQVKALSSDTFTFYVFSDDGARLWVNNQLLVDKWVPQGPTEWTGTIALVADKKYDIRMEYFDVRVNAVARLFWSNPSMERQVIPQNQLFSPPPDPEPPAAPTGVTATVTPERVVELTWKQSTSPGITQNKVYRSAKGSGPFELVGTLAAGTRFEVKPAPGSAYYAVTAIGLAGESAYSIPVLAKVD